MSWRLAQALDHVIALEPALGAAASVRPGPATDPFRDPPAAERGDFARLYRAARRRVGRPLAAQAALALHTRLGRGDRVLLTTGLVAAGIPRGETDGPSGTLALARALILSRRVRATILAEDAVVPALAAAAAVLAASEEDGAFWLPGLTLQGISARVEDAERESRALWRDLRPVAIVSIEKLGPNGRGVIHNMRGQDVTATQARTDLLFAMANAARRLTVGVGDRGNEIGMGGLGTGARCQCPCGGRIACAVPAAVPVVAFSSNWGAQAMTAALAAVTRMPRLLPRPQSEVRMLRRLARAGVVDGVTRRRAPSVDGGGLALQAAILTLLHSLIETPARS